MKNMEQILPICQQISRTNSLKMDKKIDRQESPSKQTIKQTL